MNADEAAVGPPRLLAVGAFLIVIKGILETVASGSVEQMHEVVE